MNLYSAVRFKLCTRQSGSLKVPHFFSHLAFGSNITHAVCRVFQEAAEEIIRSFHTVPWREVRMVKLVVKCWCHAEMLQVLIDAPVGDLICIMLVEQACLGARCN